MTRADLYLVENGYFDSRARAAAAIKAGKVLVDGVTIYKASAKIPDNANVTAEPEHPWVSRGGLKLVHALDVFKVDPSGRTCLDVGSSTGGFTHVLLSRGAAKIYAVDVGTDQLHQSLRGNDQIISMESTDARSLTADMFDPLPNLIVCDASFIALNKVLHVPLSLMGSAAELVTLVKPQFEVGRDGIGKGGIVKSAALAEASLKHVQTWLSKEGWEVKATTISPIKGGSGNTEFLLHAVKK